ncbi:MAG: hypothetical protein VX908_06750 [Planctomycetota bacterium]|nr:hypothetical protein [Planctomycetota bacterium]
MTKEHEDMPTLTDADAHMLDRLVDAEFDPSKITGLDAADQARLDRIVSILGLLDSYPVAELSSEDRTTLVHATLTRIDRAESEQNDRMRLEPGSGPASRMGVPELIAVAAIFIFGLSLIFTMMNATRETSTRSVHRHNLAQIGGAFFNHAGDNDGILANTNAPEWDSLFGETTNRLDLQPLVEQDYLASDVPGLQDESRWSYQTQPRTHVFQASQPAMTVLMGNRNPYMTRGIVEVWKDKVKIGTFPATFTWSPSVLLSDGSIQDIEGHAYEGDDMRTPDPLCRDLEQADVFLTHPIAH